MKKREGLLKLGRISKSDIELNEETIRKGAEQPLSIPKVVTWFLPTVTHALRGGVFTIFKFSEMLSKRHGTLCIFVLYAIDGREFDTTDLVDSLKLNFPDLFFIVRTFVKERDNIDDIPPSEVAFCTLWTTAYLLLRYNKVYRKFYFMQDYEPMFYEGGAVYILIEQTYRFGFSCIANTPGVAERFKEYSNDVVTFLPGIDRSQFYPGDISHTKRKKFRLVFYGRPGNPRNSFHLGIEVLCDVKRLLGERAEIISVGAEWSPSDYDIDGVVENWGLLKSIEEVAQCYRDSDMGLVFMATPHPSYQPLEYMASGCVVATNLNEGTRWLLNKDNALLLEPNPGVAAERIVETLEDSAKMAKLRQNGLQTVSELDWDAGYQVFESRLKTLA